MPKLFRDFGPPPGRLSGLVELKEPEVDYWKGQEVVLD